MKLLQVALLFTSMMLVAHASDEFQLEISEDCKRLGFCEDVPNYPKEQAAKVISELSDLSMFQNDILDVPDINRRVGPEEENLELCQFEEKVVHPKAAVDKGGEWNIVLNQDDNPIQGFKVEICKQDVTSCSGMAVFGNGYQGYCKQKYVYRKMTVLQKDGSKLTKSLKLPSCCTCMARLIMS